MRLAAEAGGAKGMNDETSVWGISEWVQMKCFSQLQREKGEGGEGWPKFKLCGGRDDIYLQAREVRPFCSAFTMATVVLFAFSIALIFFAPFHPLSTGWSSSQVPHTFLPAAAQAVECQKSISTQPRSATPSSTLYFSLPFSLCLNWISQKTRRGEGELPRTPDGEH